MKKNFLVGILIISTSFTVFSQWKILTPGQTSLIRDISVVNDNTIWLMDQTHTDVSYTTDGGANWTTKTLPSPITNTYGGFCATSATTAYIVVSIGDVGIFKTTDSGNTWIKQSSGFSSANGSFPDIVYFFNENEGVSIGDGIGTSNLEIYTTTNGGTQWNRVPNSSFPTSTLNYTQNSNITYRVHGNSFYLYTGYGIYITKDKGTTWTSLTGTTAYTSFDFMENGLNGILAKNSTSFFKTTDGAATITAINYPLNANPNIYYSPNQNVYFSSDGSYGLSYTVDNGQTWVQHPSFVNAGTGQIVTTSSGKIFMGGFGKLYTTNNYLSQNTALINAVITSENTLDINFNSSVDITTAQNSSNYTFKTSNGSILSIASAILDNSNNSIVHITLNSSITEGIGRYILSTNIVDTNNNPILPSTVNVYNPVYKRVTSSAGALYTTLTQSECDTVSHLYITGTLDARDFKLMRDNMPKLTTIDVRGASIAAYTGADGTNSISTTYIANEFPQYAFYSQTTGAKTSIKSVNFPSSITSIGDYAFRNCSNLNWTSYPNAITNIGAYTFSGATNFTTFNLPTSLVKIGSHAFSNCNSFLTMTIPAKVSSIGSLAFDACTNLSQVSVDATNLYYSSLNGVLYNKSQTNLILYPISKSGLIFYVPSTVTTIEGSAFTSCASLGAVHIPASVTYIDKSGNFKFCPYLLQINVISENTNYASIDGVLFDKNITTLMAFPGAKYGSYTIPSTVTTINNSAFALNTGLTEINIPSSVTTFGGTVFSNCTGLTTANIYSPMIGTAAFQNCTKLSNLNLNSSVRNISSYAFYLCSSLKSLNIPDSVLYINSYAFGYCSGLSSIYANPKTPIDLTNSTEVFYDVDKYSCKLYVPSGSKEAYQTAYQWKDFLNIYEMNTGLTPISQSNIKLIVNNGNLIVKNVTPNDIIRIYSINGMKIAEKTASNNQCIFNLTKGVYIVKVNNYSGKVIL